MRNALRNGRTIRSDVRQRMKGIDDDWPALQRFATSALEIRKLILSKRLDAASGLKWLSEPDRAPLASAGNQVQAAVLNHLADCWHEWLESIGSDESRWLASSSIPPLRGTPGEVRGEGDFEHLCGTAALGCARESQPGRLCHRKSPSPLPSPGVPGEGGGRRRILKPPARADWENTKLPGEWPDD